jgi:hypothetical protein
MFTVKSRRPPLSPGGTGGSNPPLHPKTFRRATGPLPFRTDRRFFQGRPRPSGRLPGFGISGSRVFHCSSVRSRVQRIPVLMSLLALWRNEAPGAPAGLAGTTSGSASMHRTVPNQRRVPTIFHLFALSLAELSPTPQQANSSGLIRCQRQGQWPGGMPSIRLAAWVSAKFFRQSRFD